MSDELRAGLSVMKRLPPAQIEENLTALVTLAPDLSEELLTHIDQPLVVSHDSTVGRKFLLCDYNRDGDSFRSPWSNSYFPPMEEGFLPSERLRRLEVDANELFDAYRELYYESAGSLSSVYFWEKDDGSADPIRTGFSGCWLIKKVIPEGARYVNEGSWDSIHISEAARYGPNWQYKLTSTVMLRMVVQGPDSTGSVLFSGSFNRQIQRTVPVVDERKEVDHLAELGPMIEEMESTMRTSVDSLYISKTRETVNTLRSRSDAASQGDRSHMSSLAQAVKLVAAARTDDLDL